MAPAAVLAARLPLHGGALADPIDLIHQIPGPLIGHVHRPARSRDRAAGTDILEQLDFAGADATFRVQIDPNA